MNEAVNTWNEKHPNQLLVLNRYENIFTYVFIIRKMELMKKNFQYQEIALERHGMHL